MNAETRATRITIATRWLERLQEAIEAGETGRIAGRIKRTRKAIARLGDDDAAADLRNRLALLTMAAVS